MAQIKIYLRGERLAASRKAVSDALHAGVTGVLGLPAGKRCHRFLPLEAEDFIYPADRSDRSTIIDVSLFEGRTAKTKKAFIRAIFQRRETDAGISPRDVELTLFETPKANWGIRGQPADELAPNCKVEK
jgi:phenylpyruvate tautomerase PptA (4-oxalocrotonate tautomerase family)